MCVIPLHPWLTSTLHGTHFVLFSTSVVLSLFVLQFILFALFLFPRHPFLSLFSHFLSYLSFEVNSTNITTSLLVHSVLLCSVLLVFHIFVLHALYRNLFYSFYFKDYSEWKL